MGSSWRDTVRRRQAEAIEAGAEDFDPERRSEEARLAELHDDEHAGAGASRIV